MKYSQCSTCIWIWMNWAHLIKSRIQHFHFNGTASGSQTTLKMMIEFLRLNFSQIQIWWNRCVWMSGIPCAVLQYRNIANLWNVSTWHRNIVRRSNKKNCLHSCILQLSVELEFFSRYQPVTGAVLHSLEHFSSYILIANILPTNKFINVRFSMEIEHIHLNRINRFMLSI